MTTEEKVFLKFFIKGIEDRKATLASGKYCAKDVDFVQITPAGGNLTVEREVDQEILDRYPQAYETWKKGQEVPVNGTHIKNWAAISPAQVEMLLRANVRTIEELAELPESGVQRIGMGGVALREKAQAWQDSAKGTGITAGQIESLQVKINDLENDIEAYKKAIKTDDNAKLVVQLAEAREQIDNLTAENIKLKTKKKPGRKPKVKK